MENGHQRTDYTPPKLFLRFFRWYCDPQLIKYIEGDLVELYAERVKTYRKVRADFQFIIDVLLLFRPGIVRQLNNHSRINHIVMYRSYLTTGWRSLVKQRTYSFIKIGGFSLGIAACFLIALLIRDELTYDSFYPNADRAFRIVGSLEKDGVVESGVHFQPPFASALLDDFPEIEKAGRYNNVALFGAANAAIRRGDQLENNYEDRITYFDQSLFEILQFPLIMGNPQKALTDPYTVVISKAKAQQYFSDEDPIGKSLIINDDKEHPYTITAVLDDISEKSHLRFDFLLTLKGKEFWPGEQTDWCCSNYPTYILVREDTDIKALEQKLEATVLEKYVKPRLVAMGRKDIDEYLKSLSLRLQPVSEIHLHSAGIDDGLSHGDIKFVWMFGAVAAFVLIIACINFINLSTAKSANRAKEVGLRKVVGSHRSDLVRQFMAESMLYSVFSFIIGLALASFLLPYFNFIAGKHLQFPWQEWWLLPVVLVSAISIGLVAGVYPSIYLSAFKPAHVLKGNVSRGSKTSNMRAALVVIQFTTSIVLIVGTFMIYRQMQFILNTKVGFNKDNVLVVQGTHMLGEKIDIFKESIRQLPDVTQATIGDYLPVRGTKRNGNTFNVEGNQKLDVPIQGQFWHADEDYLAVMGIKLIAGRNFNPDLESDKTAVIINQRMASGLCLTDPVGAVITNGTPRTVIGVVEDFHFESFKQNIEPLAINFEKSTGIVSARIAPGADPSKTIESVIQLWKQLAPNQPIRYTFLDETYARMYEDVKRMGMVFTSCSVFAIIVACLGLFGLSAFMAEQRRKEISIRLILGASMNSVLTLVMKNFLSLILISFVIATPIAWYFINEWLQDYEYKTEITWDVFAIAGIIALGIAVITISYQSVRAALANPIDHLRSE